MPATWPKIPPKSGSFYAILSEQPGVEGVEAWIPAFGIVTEFNYASLLALVFSLAGAYSVAVVRGKFVPVG